MVLHIKNRIGKKGESETQSTILRTIVTIPIIIVIIIFFANLWLSSKPSPEKNFIEMVGLMGATEDGESFMHNLYLKDHQIIGFSVGSTQVETTDQKVAKRPDTAACNSGPCICLCKNLCVNFQEANCKSVKGIDLYTANGNIGGSNIGMISKLALTSGKKSTICVLVEKNKREMKFSECLKAV